jgi:Icc-related predicted phosphoesterase
MKVCVCADLHGNLPEIPECDLLLIAGDITPFHDHSLGFQQKWLNTTFRKWLLEINASTYFCPGNHEFIFETNKEIDPIVNDRCINDKYLLWNNIKIYFTGWTPWFQSWAFNGYEKELEKTYKNLPKYIYDKKYDLRKIYSRMPQDTEILVCHGPPYGFGDLTQDGKHVGSMALRECLETLPKLRYLICGHIHFSHGEYEYNGIKIINCSLLNEQYQMVHKPVVFDY